jgi:hypothetical protein
VAFRGRAAYPGSDQGYARGMDYQYGGSGSGGGTMAQGTARLSQGIGSVGSMAADWEPSILFLFGLVIAEMIAFRVLSRVLK